MLACPHRPPCTACPRFAQPGIAPAAYQRLDELARASGTAPLRVLSGSMSGFRHRARLAIRGRMGSPKIGLFTEGTHRVVHVPRCVVHHPLINRAAEVVRRVLAEQRIASYSESAHLGLARYLQVAIERRSQSAQLVLIANSPSSAPLQQCFDLVRARLGAELHSLWFNSNRGTSNVILGAEFEHICGPRSVVESFGGPLIHYPPGAFGQNNLDLAERLVEHVRSLVPVGARVAEFYAGVGAIGLSLLEKVTELRLNELGPHSLHGLELGIAALSAAERAKLSVIPGAAGATAHAAAGADIVIADPPRRGLDPPLIQALLERPPKRFIYVSCALDSLQRDAALLTAGAKLALTSITAFDLMPYTAHVETVACFEPRPA